MFNKKMITMMVLLAVLAAGAANAGDYKVYGKLHLSVDMLNDSDASTMTLVSNTSRFGIKGAAELNENFVFIWQFEQKLDMAMKGDQTLANRNTFLGLKGTWGTALFGIHDTPFKTLGRKSTFFFDELGDHRQVTMGWDQRLQQVFMYATPDFSGFGATLAYQFDQDSKLDVEYDPDDSSARDAYEGQTAFSANAIYNKDALMIGVAYEAYSKGHSDTYGPENIYGDGYSAIRFAGKYTMEKFAFSALYQSASNMNQYWDTINSTLQSGGTASTFGLEGKFQFNPKFALKASYYMANPDGDAENMDGTDVDESDNGYNLMALGIDHTFAKDLAFYVQYAMIMNGEVSDAGLGGVAHGSYVAPTGPGENPTGFSFGMWKKF